ncbi:hypothetical protein C2869_16725 [Saccharobesus litoralis]|uniref:Uncharacterized protein n=1 Tax=Saccharobesus litoralis TaxID=2172099 RepID=A0A2S0VUR6_9ALTE|nr:hypothetical protein C2869_16725 [Saccharobesus litoralis]
MGFIKFIFDFQVIRKTLDKKVKVFTKTFLLKYQTDDILKISKTGKTGAKKTKMRFRQEQLYQT